MTPRNFLFFELRLPELDLSGTSLKQKDIQYADYTTTDIPRFVSQPTDNNLLHGQYLVTSAGEIIAVYRNTETLFDKTGSIQVKTVLYVDSDAYDYSVIFNVHFTQGKVQHILPMPMIRHNNLSRKHSDLRLENKLSQILYSKYWVCRCYYTCKKILYRFVKKLCRLAK